MKKINFLEKLHNQSKRDYVARVTDFDKAECAIIAKQFGEAYWDGERQFGYGGYHYDGRWRAVSDAMTAYYSIKPGDRILDVGCGKGYLLYEFTQSVPGVNVSGIDISKYGIEKSKSEIKNFVQVASCTKLPFEDNSFDFVVSLGTLHNLYNYELKKAIQEIERVGKRTKYICVESYRNEHEKANLLYWQLTCETFYNPKEWHWALKEFGYSGDYGFIYFE